MVKIIIPGEPKGKGRPRMSRKTGTIHTPRDTMVYENYVKLIYQSQCKEKLKGQLEAVIKAYYSIPASDSIKKRIKKLDGTIRPVKKPDIDNIAKIILDSLNKIAYDDDKQIVSLKFDKFYSDRPRVELELKEV